jgi:parvulin-like peptidyl-prolyl isomerase
MVKKKKGERSKFIKLRKRDIVIGSFVLVAIILLVIVSISLGLGKNSNIVVASVNGENVMQSEVEYFKQSSIIQGEEIDDELALDQAINQKLILQEARSLGYTVTVKETEAILIQQYSQQGIDIEVLKSELESQGESYKDLLEMYSDKLTVEGYISGEFPLSDVSREESQEFYEKYKDQLGQNGEIPSFEEIETQINDYLKLEKQSLEIYEFLQELKMDAEIIYF